MFTLASLQYTARYIFRASDHHRLVPSYPVSDQSSLSTPGEVPTGIYMSPRPVVAPVQLCQAQTQHRHRYPGRDLRTTAIQLPPPSPDEPSDGQGRALPPPPPPHTHTPADTTAAGARAHRPSGTDLPYETPRQQLRSLVAVHIGWDGAKLLGTLGVMA